MCLREIIENVVEKKKQKKELFKSMQEQDRMQELIEERKMSANERELRRFMKESREENIKFQLGKMRKQREKEINFGHNPLDTPNIMKAEWQIMKEKNMFKGNSNMFSNGEFIHKDNPKLLKNSGWLIH